mgnify:FL=1
MSTEEQDKLQQQRDRRKRINRMKTGMIMIIFVWMIVSFVAIVALTICLVKTNIKLNKFLDAGFEKQTSTEVTALPTEKENDAEPENAYANVITGIDTDDNIAQEGDTHYVYLTFDSEPGENTDLILDALAEKGIKATFFVDGDASGENEAVYKRIVDEGHTIGMHSYCNQYSTIYSSTDAFSADYLQIHDYIYNVTGVDSKFYRFPGGSSNEISNVNMAEFVSILNQKDVAYFDWNVSAGDASSDYTVEDIVSNVTEGVAKYKTSVVLLHDNSNKSTTAEAIGPLVDALQAMQAEILPIDENTYVVQYIKAYSVE